MRRGRPSNQPHQDIESPSPISQGTSDDRFQDHKNSFVKRTLCKLLSGIISSIDKLYLLAFCASFVCLLGVLSLWRPISLRKDFTIGYAVVDPESCGSDEDRVFNVFEWAVQNGAYIHYNLTTGVFPVPGGKDGATLRGLMARGTIRAGEVLFAVPSPLMLSLAALSRDPALRDVYNATPLLHDGFGGLAFYLIHEALNRSSRWRPYLCSLPRHVPLPVFYSPAKLRQANASLPPAQRAQLAALIESRRDTIEVHYATVMAPLFAKYPDRFRPVDYTYARWAWACSVVMSRTWGRQFADPVLRARSGANTSMVHVLVPAADMPNHAVGAREAMQGPGGVLLLHAAANLSRGDQAFISYGRKCDAEFLAHYGFAPPGNAAAPCREGLVTAPVGGNLSAEAAAANATLWRRAWRARFARFLAAVERGLPPPLLPPDAGAPPPAANASAPHLVRGDGGGAGAEDGAGAA